MHRTMVVRTAANYIVVWETYPRVLLIDWEKRCCNNVKICEK